GGRHTLLEHVQGGRHGRRGERGARAAAQCVGGGRRVGRERVQTGREEGQEGRGAREERVDGGVVLVCRAHADRRRDARGAGDGVVVVVIAGRDDRGDAVRAQRVDGGLQHVVVAWRHEAPGAQAHVDR